jgi:luciferase family oxidoreductase group 1
MALSLSVLDLSPIVQGGTPAQALACSRDLAGHAEAWGYKRYWLAEHHNMPGIACAATALVIAHVAAGTTRIRVGAGGIMLPNHSPLQVAEQFGTLESLFPGRIDLGLGRAPGTDRAATLALRRPLNWNPESFPQDVQELMSYFEEAQPGQLVRAVPGAGLKIPIWILGSSTFGARVAAAFGLPFAFASHFAPWEMTEALAIYRGQFKPSDRLAAPYVMLGVNVVAAETDAEARFLASSGLESFTRLREGHPIPLPPPSREWTRQDADQPTPLDLARVSAVGDAAAVGRQLREFAETNRADELILVSHIYEHSARLRSYQLSAAEFRNSDTLSHPKENN